MGREIENYHLSAVKINSNQKSPFADFKLKTSPFGIIKLKILEISILKSLIKFVKILESSRYFSFSLIHVTFELKSIKIPSKFCKSIIFLTTKNQKPPKSPLLITVLQQPQYFNFSSNFPRSLKTIFNMSNANNNKFYFVQKTLETFEWFSKMRMNNINKQFGRGKRL